VRNLLSFNAGMTFAAVFTNVWCTEFLTLSNSDTSVNALVAEDPRKHRVKLCFLS
jgi:hypothetical protein